MLPSDTEFLLLALVAPRELSGRDVAKRYREETGRTISYGTLYTAFRRMREAGWVKARDEENDGRVRYFRMTAAGAAALRKGREKYSRFSRFGLPATEGV